ncbi:acetylserotonin O-methyltransferase [Streptomyces sp. MUM 178J]|uniref:acetylserotonin O-methyltransferase n=1 Tax=Streptomyces sp. MUM 178J TaxID=2791991 RepID=UPI001F045EFA|nr:acetylserotonin O-methyltransferase [Streptomyces sp. MUM 178J]WRQ80670.1 methyltransferase [Streptomyces sp. MUM 178J]
MTADVQAAAQQAVELITGGWRAQALHTAVKLRIPDHIEAGRVRSGELADATGAEEEGIRRLMRLLTAMGVFDGGERTGHRNTPVSRTLLDRPGSLRDMCLLYGEEFYTAWGHAPQAISTVSAGFEAAYGQPLYAYLGEHPDASDRFQRAMKAGNLFFDRVPEIFDFSGKHVVDVGGGNGQLLAAVLGAVPDARGTLLDREHVMPAARDNLAATLEDGDRVTLVGGSMFEAVPEGGDVYLLCRVLAGWDDDRLVTVFENCRRSMAGPESRLLIFERVVTDEGCTMLPALWDLHLLMTNGGRHRTVETFTRLLDRAGLDVERIAELPAETTALIAAPRG